MKYLKTYEIHKYIGDFYYIPYNDINLISMAIDKIDTTNEMRKILKNSAFNSLKLYKNIIGFFIGVTDYKSDQQHWSCTDRADKKTGYNSYIEDNKINYSYKGEIKLEDWEIAANKYNI